MFMLPARKPKKLHFCVSLLAVAGLLSGCVEGALSTREARIGPDDGTDSCRAQLVALDSTGNYFGAEILTGAAVGAATGALAGGLIGGNWKGALIGAAAGGVLGGSVGYWSALQQQNRDQAAMFSQVGGDLARENAQIDRTQFAFDQLTDCRYRQAQAIRADYAAGRIDRNTALTQMAIVRQHAQTDLAVARRINTQIAGRADQFEVAADNLAPGTKSAITAQASASGQATVRRAATLKLTPDPNAPDIAKLNARQPVSVAPGRGGYVVVQTANGQRGYVQAADLQGAAVRDTTLAASSSTDVRMLAGSNAARRDSFSQSVAVSEQAATSGFELAS
jgi:hypothetical protein